MVRKSGTTGSLLLRKAAFLLLAEKSGPERQSQRSGPQTGSSHLGRSSQDSAGIGNNDVATGANDQVVAECIGGVRRNHAAGSAGHRGGLRCVRQAEVGGKDVEVDEINEAIAIEVAVSKAQSGTHPEV